MDKRLGQQTPTQSYILPYDKTYGNDAIELYNSSGKTAQQWQELLMYDILATDKEELYVHSKFGYSVPRRNGKNEVVAIREMYGLIKGEHILHTAHLATTAHSAWERLLRLLESSDEKDRIVNTYRAFGKEHIELNNGGRIEFRTRTSKGGLGEGFDLLIIDEAQEYKDDQESSLKYVVSDSKNPQTIFLGTPPTPVSSGTVFTKFRENVLKGNVKNAGWEEWSIENQSDPNDRELWYKTNPSLGTVLTERKIEDEIGTDDIDFNIQRLGLWIRYNLKSEITEEDWAKCKISSKPEFKGKLFVGIKSGQDGTNIAMSICVKTEDGYQFVEGIDCRPIRNGCDWIIDFLVRCKSISKIILDGEYCRDILLPKIKDFRIKTPTIVMTVKEVISAYSLFEHDLYGDKIRHANQPSLTAVATNVEKRAIGTNGGFGYKCLKPTLDISILDSVVLANWSCSTSKERRKQKISY